MDRCILHLNIRSVLGFARAVYSRRVSRRAIVWLLAALAGCGDDTRSITVIDSQVELAFEIQSATVRVDRMFTKDVPLTFTLELAGNADAFPGPDQQPIAGDVFVAVMDPTPLGDGALAGELPDHQRYQLLQAVLPAQVGYAWFSPDPPCFPGCTRTASFTMTLADSILGGVAPASADIQIAFMATLSGWVISADSPRTAAPALTLTVR